MRHTPCRVSRADHAGILARDGVSVVRPLVAVVPFPDQQTGRRPPSLAMLRRAASAACRAAGAAASTSARPLTARGMAYLPMVRVPKAHPLLCAVCRPTVALTHQPLPRPTTRRCTTTYQAGGACCPTSSRGCVAVVEEAKRTLTPKRKRCAFRPPPPQACARRELPARGWRSTCRHHCPVMMDGGQHMRTQAHTQETRLTDTTLFSCCGSVWCT